MRSLRHVPVLLLAVAAFGAQAQSPAMMPVPQGVLNLSSSATLEVAKDLMNVTFTVTRDGADAVSYTHLTLPTKRIV